MEFAESREYDGLFKGVFFIVEANSFELDYLRQQFNNNTFPLWKRKSWEDVNVGRSATIGSCAGKPVCISLRYITINNKLVCFYNATSVVVDYNMVEEWLRYYGKNVKVDGQWAHCDANNFHQCIGALFDAERAASKGKS